MTWFARAALTCVLALARVSTSSAGEAEAIQAALAAPLLPPGQSLRELKAFVQPRIIAPPRASDRAAW
jgi:hypothetical protein